MTDQADPSDRSIRHFLAQWKPVYVIGVDEDGSEHKVPTPKHTKRWDVVVKSLRDLDCVRVRAYDHADSVLGTKVLRIVDNGGAGSVGGIAPATTGGVDVAAIVGAVAASLTTSMTQLLTHAQASIKEVIVETQKAHDVSFKEMVAITKVATENAATLQKMVQQDLIDRREALEREREEREEQAQAEADAKEKEDSERSQLNEVILPLVAAHAPALLEAAKDFLKRAPVAQSSHSNGTPPKANVEVREVKPKPEKAPDGA